MTKARWVLVAVAISFVLLLGGMTASFLSQSSCPEPVARSLAANTSVPPPVASTPAAPVEMEVISKNANSPFPLGHKRRAVKRTVTLRTKDQSQLPNLESPPLGFFIDQFSTSSGSRVIPEDAVHVAYSKPGGSTLQFVICINASPVEAGSYSGELRLDDSRFKPLDIELKADRQFHPMNLLILVMALAGLLGAGFKYAADQRKKKAKLWDFGGIRTWAGEHFAALGTGFFAVAGSFLTTTAYFSSSFGEKPMELVGLVSGAFSLMLGSLTVGDAAKPK